MNAKQFIELVQQFFAGVQVDEHSALLVALGAVGGMMLGGRHRIGGAYRQYRRRWGRRYY